MKHKNGRLLIYALIAAILVTALAGFNALRRLDKWTQDALFQRPGATSPEILIIGIDEKALTEIGPYNTWDRNIVASALEKLAEDPATQPAVVSIDTLYAGESDPEADARLAAAAEKLGCVVTAAVADFGTMYAVTDEGGLDVNSYSVKQFEEPYAALRAVTVQGHINAMYDGDGIMRHGVLYVDVPDSAAEDGTGGRVYSMAYETARLYLEKQGETIRQPYTDRRGHFYIPFSGDLGDFYDGVSIADLLRGDVDRSYFAGKVVFIGPYAVGLQDAYFTPIRRAEQMYGVELQANVVQSFLDGNYKREMQDLPQLVLLFLLSGIAMYLFLRCKIGKGALIGLALIVLGLGGSMLLYSLGWVTHPIWIPVAVLLLFIVSVVRHYILAAMDRARVTRTFERYVAPEIVQEILKEGTDSLHLGGNLCEIAVLFVDVRGFTTMSERLQPEQVVFILNRYLDMTSRCVEQNHGTLDKFVGDATMAFWGAPLPMEDPVYHAAKTAMDIIDGAEELSKQLKEEIGEELHVGVGVHFGPAVVGNMGSERRMDYTAIGDTVNTSARLESNAPGGTVYISRAVADALGSRAKTTSLGGTVRLKGKTEGFEVLTLDALD
ncbi:MAG: adenylate/guanylate cyclase domain-containing protein [Oscillospiraceae bacterium]|nr:adenylate/guanylate cyclase domain-containing protein [Oscillospiraceae bacterium]